MNINVAGAPTPFAPMVPALAGPFLALMLLLVASVGCDRPPDTLFAGGFDDAAMDEAMADAREHLDHFIKAITESDPDEYSIKVRIEDGDEVEYFWTADVKYADDHFSAIIANDPGVVTNVKIGDPVTVPRDEVADWLYLNGDLMHGNYTLRVMLPGMPPAEQKLWKSRMAPLPE